MIHQPAVAVADASGTADRAGVLWRRLLGLRIARGSLVRSLSALC